MYDNTPSWPMFAWRTQAGMPGDQTLLHKHRIAPPPIIFIWFSDTSTNAVILRGAEGEVAESIIQRITLALLERWYDRRWWVRAGREHFPPPLNRPDGHKSPGRRFSFVFCYSGFCNFGQGCPPCRMTWEWDGTMEEEISSLKNVATNCPIWTALVQC